MTVEFKSLAALILVLVLMGIGLTLALTGDLAATVVWASCGSMVTGFVAGWITPAPGSKGGV